MDQACQPAHKTRIKFLLVCPSLRGGGAERVMLTLLRHLDRDQFELTLVVVDGRNAAYLADRPADIAYVDLGCSRVREAPFKLCQVIWKVRPQVVLSTLGHLNLVLGALIPLLPRDTAFVAREATIISELLRPLKRPEPWRLVYRLLYRRYDRIVCQSHAMKDDLVHQFGLPAARATVINNPVDIDRIRARLAAHPPAPPGPRGTSLRLVAAGRLSHEKGYDMLLHAVAMLRDLEVSLQILGEGPLRPDLERLINDLHLEGVVHLLGFQRDPYRYFAAADAFVLSSRFEGFPNVVLEALVCGTGIITTPAVGGVAEIVAGVEGCTMASEISATSLAEAIRKWAQGPRTPPPPSALARFHVDAIVKQYEELLTAIAVPRRPGTTRLQPKDSTLHRPPMGRRFLGRPSEARTKPRASPN